MSDLKIKKSGIGAIHDNKIKDIDFAKLALQLNIQIRNLGKNGKPKTNEELELRIDNYFVLCQSYGLPPTVERFGSFN